MAESSTLLSGRTICVITGASRGYGKCLAEILVSILPAGSCCLLLARNVEQLKELAAGLNNDRVSVVWNSLDQSDLKACSGENVKSILNNTGVKFDQFDTAILIHNAGTVGDLTKFTWDFTEAGTVVDSMNINVTGPILLNAILLSEMRKSNVKNKVIINISSLAALQPFSSWSLYCAGKAARNMFFGTLAKEDPSVRVLNWAPGPLDTEMQEKTRKCADKTIQEAFIDMHEKGKLLSCEESVRKLIAVLEKNTFTSGDHVDFYDV